MPFKECFTGKRILITGAGQGIGRALAKRLYDYGATVYALSKTAERLETLKSECPNITTLCVDLSNWNVTREAVSQIGPVDHLVNNAVYLEEGDFLNVTPSSFDETMNVGLKSYINVSQVIAKGMIDSGIKGSIVNISSLASTLPFSTICVYSIMKAGVDMLTKLMALDLGPHGIRVNAVKMCVIDTDSSRKFLAVSAKAADTNVESFKEALDERTPIRSFAMTVDSAVNSILFPLSDLSSHLHGECIMVDGGYCLT